MNFVGEEPPQYPATASYYIWCAVTRCPATEYFQAFFNFARPTLETYVSFPTRGIRICTVSTSSNDSVFTNAKTGYSVLSMVIRNSQSMNLTDLEASLFLAFQQGIQQVDGEQRLNAIAPANSKGYYTDDTVAATYLVALKEVVTSQIFPNMISLQFKKYKGLVFSYQGTFTQNYLTNQTSPLPLFDTSHLGITMSAQVGRVIVNDNIEQYGLGIGGTDPPYLESQPTSPSGIKYFAVVAPFPLTAFMCDFFREKAATLNLPVNSIRTSIYFWSMIGGIVKSPTIRSFFSSYDTSAHVCLCFMNSERDFVQLVKNYYIEWTKKSYFNPSNIPIVVIPSTASDCLDIVYTNPDGYSSNIGPVDVVEGIQEVSLWEKVPGQKGRRQPDADYKWVFVGPMAFTDLGGIAYNHSLYIPTTPQPLIWTGVNAAYWNAVMSETPTAEVFADYPAQSEANLLSMLALRQYNTQERARIQLTIALRSVITNSDWTLKQLLCSDAVIPDNISIVPQLISWFNVVYPEAVSAAGLSTQSLNGIEERLTPYLKGEISLEQLIKASPSNAIQYATQLLHLGQYFRTGAYP